MAFYSRRWGGLRRYGYRNWRRRPWYRRRWRTRPRRYRVRRRRRRLLRRKTRHVPVMQWNPINKKRCTIRGFCPLVYCLGGQKGIMDFTYPGNKLILGWLGGGVHSSLLSLLDLFWEERYWRARWSSSNQGYNLFRYYGATITLYPVMYYTYIFWYSTEELTEDVEPLTVCHPSQLLLSKHHVIVHRLDGFQKTKPIKLHIKPPSQMTGTWHTFAAWAKQPLLKWRISLLDIENPWTGFPNDQTQGVHCTVWARHKTERPTEARSLDLWYFPLLDDGTDLSVTMHKIKWNNDGTGPKYDEANFWPVAAQFQRLLVPFYMYGFGRSATFYDMNETTHEPGPTEGNMGSFLFLKFLNPPCWRGSEGQFPQFKDDMCFMTFGTVAQLCAQGPWCMKRIGTNTAGVNISMKYKFYFQWGGTPGTNLPPVQPVAGNPGQPLLQSTLRWGNTIRADIRDPTTVGEEVLWPEDLDEHGIITSQAFRRITQPSVSTGSRSLGTLGCLRPAVSSGRKRPRHSFEESEEEEHSSSPQETENYSTEEEEEEMERARRKQHRRKRKRLEQLLRGLSNLGFRRPMMAGPSGNYQKSNSI
ncbi:putative ORF1 [Rodent Torque teno virus 3]|uniref:Capsid protein n=1 Tax=Rodent Torque teno virus 3 TaxID=2054610 RepID=A0A2H4QBC0_9VIRU|nr:putative ORF1 [Rodent Torque teno virus 3]ATX61866.1 putative ORF1 [Rodent Torque teno virus 3]